MAQYFTRRFHIIQTHCAMFPYCLSDDDPETDFASDLDSMRHPVLDRITGNTPTQSPSAAAANGANGTPIYNHSYLEATSTSFREGLRPPSASSREAALTDDRLQVGFWGMVFLAMFVLFAVWKSWKCMYM